MLQRFLSASEIATGVPVSHKNSMEPSPAYTYQADNPRRDWRRQRRESISPTNGATGVAVSTNTTVTFSEAMNASTVNGASFAG